VEHGETGLLFDTGNAGELGYAIVQILSAPDVAQKMGQAARAKVEAEFGLANFVRRYEQIYTEVKQLHAR
jgi:glycosyltransferase involved in cell wall biosynthesis